MRIEVMKDLLFEDLMAFFPEDIAKDVVVAKGEHGTYIEPGFDANNWSMIRLDWMRDEELPLSLPNKYLRTYESD